MGVTCRGILQVNVCIDYKPAGDGKARAKKKPEGQLLITIWYVLTRRQPYRGFTQERIAYKYLSWSWHVKAEARNGLTHQQFARYYLMKIGLGKELTRIALDPKHPYRLASEAEVLALCPELRQSE